MGISGDNTNDLLGRLKNECKARQPAILIFSIGINDAQFLEKEEEMRISEDQFIKNLEKTIEIGQKFSKEIVFTGIIRVDEDKTTPTLWATNKHYLNNNILRYDQAISNFCLEKKLLFIPLYDLLEKKDLFDGLHPNARGHEKIFQRVKNELIKNKII